MADQDIDRMLDMHADIIGRQLEARTQSIAESLEQWRTGKPRLVTGSKRTEKRKRQRARAKARELRP